MFQPDTPLVSADPSTSSFNSTHLLQLYASPSSLRISFISTHLLQLYARWNHLPIKKKNECTTRLEHLNEIIGLERQLGMPIMIPTSTSAGTALPSQDVNDPDEPVIQEKPNLTSQIAQQLPLTKADIENYPLLRLTTMNDTFETIAISVPFHPDVIHFGRKTSEMMNSTPSNVYFDSTTLSRRHAEVWADRDGKVWIRDTRSANGTFINGLRLSSERNESDPFELRENHTLKLGLDIFGEDQTTVAHHSIVAHVDHAGLLKME